MELADPEIRNILVNESDEFIGLVRQHAGFESRLEELAQKPAPTEEEWSVPIGIIQVLLPNDFA